MEGDVARGNRGRAFLKRLGGKSRGCWWLDLSVTVLAGMVLVFASHLRMFLCICCFDVGFGPQILRDWVSICCRRILLRVGPSLACDTIMYRSRIHARVN